MASVSRTDLSKSEHDELSCVYSALILHDEGVEITAEKLQKVLTASGNNVEKYWPSLFAKALKGQDLAALLSSLGSGAVSAAPAQVVQTKAEEKPVEAKKEEKEDEDVLAGGIGFGDDDEW